MNNPELMIVMFVVLLSGCASSKVEQLDRANQFDTDGDGNLSREEYAESALSDVIEFDELDTDGDGLLTAAELVFRMRSEGRQRGQRAKGGRSRG